MRAVDGWWDRSSLPVKKISKFYSWEVGIILVVIRLWLTSHFSRDAMRCTYFRKSWLRTVSWLCRLFRSTWTTCVYGPAERTRIPGPVGDNYGSGLSGRTFPGISVSERKRPTGGLTCKRLYTEDSHLSLEFPAKAESNPGINPFWSKALNLIYCS